MHRPGLYGALSLVAAAASFAYAEDVTNASIAAIAPAEEQVATDSSALGVDYFGFEAIQLTDSIISNLSTSIQNISDADIFSFGNSDDVALRRRTFTSCKLHPDDRLWPSKIMWTLFNLVLGGRLIEAVPLSAVCYPDWPQYDEAKCEVVTANWNDPVYLAADPTAIDWPVNEGVTCIPPSFARPNATCTDGGMPAYVVNVTNVAQVQLAVNFARNLNLRLNIKNSGHDFNAKSTGGGALSIWTHYLTDIQFLGETNKYGGPAFKIGSGVSTEQLFNAAEAHGLQVVGPLARTVGIAGGYFMGGGNSPLMPKYGMGADQVLAMEVVLPDGRFVSVDEHTNPDLFFALRGAGPSTYGIVTSVVYRAWPKTPITRLTYTFSRGNVTADKFWEGMDSFHALAPTWTEAGIFTYWSVACTDTIDCTLSMAPQIAPDLSIEELEAINAPLFDSLDSLGIVVENLNYTTFDGYLSAYEDTWTVDSNTAGYWFFHTTSRIFPESNWKNAEKLAAQNAVLRDTAQAGGMVTIYYVKPPVNSALNQTNAVLPAWRTGLAFAMSNVVYGSNYTDEEIAEANKGAVEALQPWRDVSPGSGTYLNECDINEPDFQQALYGDNYAYLYQLKKKYDPWGLLYAAQSVGSEDWYVTGQIEYYPTQNGRLCPA
ncbi:hypothetical protein SUNI508_04216 [Seiridium unicorne]|uniref:FAD-binding PCMH-type domain-containing protein n=1 Tax=Seiridium unicorne TaxID=138068 RepID=A0ABR2V8S2_9PEZI